MYGGRGLSQNFNTFITNHYNKRCPYMSSDLTRFWMNSLVVVNRNYWRSNEFTGLMNEDYWTAPTFVIVNWKQNQKKRTFNWGWFLNPLVFKRETSAKEKKLDLLNMLVSLEGGKFGGKKPCISNKVITHTSKFGGKNPLYLSIRL